MCPLSRVSHKAQLSLNVSCTYMLPVAVRGSVLLWRQCNTFCTSGFVDNVMHLAQYALLKLIFCNIVISFLSTHADIITGKVGIYCLLFVWLVGWCCVFVRLLISPPRIKLVASNFARRFIGVLGRVSPILGNFAPPDAQNWTNGPTAGIPGKYVKFRVWRPTVNVTLKMRCSWNMARRGDGGRHVWI